MLEKEIEKMENNKNLFKNDNTIDDIIEDVEK